MNRTEATEAVSFPGYYLIPGYSNYAVTKEGQVLNLQTLELLKGSTNPDGYHNYRLTGDDGHTLTWGRHRLMGFVFKHPGVDIRGLTVNHENTIKGDDRLENLEWMTQQANIEHAGRMGISDKCIPLSVRDVDTGVVEDYPSIIEYARKTGLSKDAVNYRLKMGDSRVFPERKQYRATYITRPWYVPTNVDRALLMNSTSKAVLMRLTETGEVLEFKQLSQLASHLKVAPSTVTQWMSLPNQPVLPGFIQLKWGYDETPWREIGDPYLELAVSTGNKPVRVINATTQETIVFGSAVECATVMGLKPTALHYRLKSNGTTVFSDGFKYGYYSSFSVPQSQ